MISRRILAAGVLAAGSVGAAHALVLFDQGPDTGVYANGSWQNQTVLQNFADMFELSENAIVTDYDYFTDFNPATFGTMHVKLLSDSGSTTPGAYIAQEDDAATNYFTYGTYAGETIYEVDLKLANPWTITAGTLYWAGASGNGFEAAQISLGSDLNHLADDKMAQFAGSTFSNMTGGIGDQAFILEGTANPAPEPASMAALGIGIFGLIARRRLRK